MTTRETVERYFDALQNKNQWQNHLADDVVFTSHGTPAKEVAGRDAFLESTRPFYGMIDTVEVRGLIVDGTRACAMARYRLQPPVGEPFTCDVAEVFSVADGKIDTFSIYFDSAPFPGQPG